MRIRCPLSPPKVAATLLLIFAPAFSAVPIAAAPHSSLGVYAFDGNELGMSMAHFKASHQAVLCANLQSGLFSCGYDTGYIDESDPETRVDLKVTGLFVEAKLAGVWIILYDNGGICFEPLPRSAGPEQRNLWRNLCHPYLKLFAMFTGINKTVGSAKAIQSKIYPALYAVRWENSADVGEFQPHQCIDTSEPGAWFAEILKASYCDNGKPNDSIAMAIYLNKKLIRVAISRLQAPK